MRIPGTPSNRTRARARALAYIDIRNARRQTISDHTHFSHFRFFEFARARALRTRPRVLPAQHRAGREFEIEMYTIRAQIGRRERVQRELAGARVANDYRLRASGQRARALWSSLFWVAIGRTWFLFSNVNTKSNSSIQSKVGLGFG